MTKIKFLSLLVATLFITSCNKSTSSSDISSSSLSSISNTDSNSTSSSIVKDYGTTYDEFNKMAGEFDNFSVNKNDNLNNNEIYDGYYSKLQSWDNGRDLKQQLFNIIYDEQTFNPINYNNNWLTNQNADEDEIQLDKVNVLYNTNDLYKNNTYSSSNTSGWNREHAFCASLLTGQNTSSAVSSVGIATDFHNIFAASSSGNSSRSDKNFGSVSDEEDISKNYASSKVDGYDFKFTTNYFEPNDTDKGMLSRAILYMSVMYGKDSWNDNKFKVGDGVYLREEVCSISSTDHCIGNSSTLVDWANTYLVDRNEYKHNLVVYSEQHNRNPFVDFINLADYVYGNKRNSKGNINDLISTVSYLDIDNDSVHHLGISNFKNDYSVNESLNNDFNIYEISSDFSKTLVNDYVVYLDDEQIQLPYTFKSEDIGEKNFKIVANNRELILNIFVSSDGINSCNNIHTFDSYITSNKKDSSSRDEIRNKRFYINEYEFNINFNNINVTEQDFISAISNDSTYGVKVGSSTKYCDSMDFISKDIINNIDLIYFVGATASNTDETIKLSILDENDNVIYTDQQIINRDNTIIKFELEQLVSGKIMINFSNANHKAIYISSIAFNTI